MDKEKLTLKEKKDLKIEVLDKIITFLYFNVSI